MDFLHFAGGGDQITLEVPSNFMVPGGPEARAALHGPPPSFCRHWPLFEQFARRTLLSSRYAIQLPSAASAFDLCPLPEDGTLQPFDERYLTCRVKNIPATFCVLPQVWLEGMGQRAGEGGISRWLETAAMLRGSCLRTIES